MVEDGEIVKDFLVESYDNLDQLDRDFVALEIEPASPERLASIFRTIHTIKGTCGCLGFHKLEAVAHVAENLLCLLRAGTLSINAQITTALLKAVDAVRDMLRAIEATGSEGERDDSALCVTLGRLADPQPAILNDREGHINGPIFPPAPESSPPVAPPEAPHGGDEKPVDKRPTTNESVAANAIRVDVDLLDKVMNLVGELVLARNQVLQHTTSYKAAAFLRTAQRLNLITTELQESVMKTRMQPIGTLLNKFPRIARDVAAVCGKKIRLEMDGRDTELDKTILEAIKDPLTHILRNSIDHGVETPDKRRAAGKPDEGVLAMRAFHEGGQVNIEITDDGRGIDPAVIKRKAVEKGLITAEHAARMGEREAINLVFLPGFSTAEQITNVSGRGVGMDVVKTNIEKIGGTVEVQSRVGRGTALRIKIPLTLAIIPALIVTSGGERFAIPQVSLQELVRVPAGGGIERIDDAPLYRLRGNLLPLVYLNRELGLPPADAKSATNIVVLRGGERLFGLVVDQVNDTEEIVVKPLSRRLKALSTYAGATIMGDGRIALILDVVGLAKHAHLIAESPAPHSPAASADGEKDADRQQLLLFHLKDDRPMAIPLSAVARLEEFPRSALEQAGLRTVVQYRDQVMPLVNVAEALGDGRSAARTRRVKKDKAATDRVQVVVYADGLRNVGLRVEKIVDVVEQRVSLQTDAARPGVLGTAVVKDKVTELIDVAALVDGSLGGFPRLAGEAEAA